jgi:hypothetical protein
MISEPLYECPRCQTSGFTARGLAGHQCTGVNRQTGHGKPEAKRRLTGQEYLAAMSHGIAKKYTSR